MLSIKNIYKSYGDVQALNGVSFDIKKGCIFGLLGPNGAGKTTAIRIILSIIYPDKGEIQNSFNKVGYMPEERGLYPDMRLDELIRFLGNLRGMKKRDIEEQMDFWLERLELKDRKKDKVKDLSKGLKQRLHLIISVLHDPELLILDEPFTGLDPIAVMSLRDLVSELKSRGKTILLSTHWMDQAEQLCDSICLIKEGKEIYVGDLKELKESYRKDEFYLEVEGEVDFDQLPIIGEVKKKGKGFVGKTEKESSEFLRILAGMTEVIEFKLITPSLEEVFVQKVQSE